ncbi:small MutS related family protein [Heterostelium album PN500]|uniref:Small MutS related family protein n=1 Tax=Heterostelium pallidum (strain ATCC 26659 / Pp 5 / PN500) TaxID=670386 RepID=D3BV69_HETP5|nr:small MutS related family protein [Heterostelium album PN500]EFA74626.1 small MutS related family protein [Heterostelium album PN500]|eukprot:XP_020426760.1 small MutS related family protein [Heterostelium album PN500]
MFAIAAGAAFLYAAYMFIRNIWVTKEDLKDDDSVDRLHRKLDDEIAKLKQRKQYKLIDQTVADTCQQIFDLNNEGRNKSEIDLHGLFVKQSIEYLKQRIQLLKSNGYNGELLVITGLVAYNDDKNFTTLASNLNDTLKQQFREHLERDKDEDAFIVDPWKRSKVANLSAPSILDDYFQEDCQCTYHISRYFQAISDKETR